ncbi:MAG TPA: hypothetical protein VFE23_05575 [Usitatibacter sp.]|jgi:hypothetical protein|nr:hypothetical protein [Usitatibacter sp.]
MTLMFRRILLVFGFLMAAPRASLASSDVEGMWFEPDENGWGLTVIEHGETLFCVLAVYEYTGHTTWYVLPGARWDASHSTFGGDVYYPRGSEFMVYDASRFDPGAPVGKLTFSRGEGRTATISYRIEETPGSKHVQRFDFAAPLTGVRDHTDMWWGGPSQNGWGIVMLQQGNTILSLWCTYFSLPVLGVPGVPAWFMLQPGGWTSPDTYSGRIYRPFGPRWLGVVYDPSVLRAPDNGPYTLTFIDADHAVLDYSVLGMSGSLSLVRMPF